MCAGDAIEDLIISGDFDAVRDAAVTLPQAIASCVIRQAIADALWLEEYRTRSPCAGLASKQRARADARADAIDFFLEIIDPASDEDAGFGQEAELLTLDMWCLIGGIDKHHIKTRALAAIDARSPLHRRLLSDAMRQAGRLTK